MMLKTTAVLPSYPSRWHTARYLCSGAQRQKPTYPSAVAGTHKATFSGDFAYYIDAFSSATTPPRYTLHAANGKELKEILNNNAFAERLKAYQLPTKEYFQIKTSRATPQCLYNEAL